VNFVFSKKLNVNCALSKYFEGHPRHHPVDFFWLDYVIMKCDLFLAICVVATESASESLAEIVVSMQVNAKSLLFDLSWVCWALSWGLNHLGA